MEYVTVRGRKMKKIPDAEIQFFQLWVEGLMGHRKILDLEHDKYINRLSKKYDMPFDDVQFQISFRRCKDVWNVLNMPHKKFLAFDEEIGKIPTKNTEKFLVEYDKLLRETAKEYGLIVPD